MWRFGVLMRRRSTTNARPTASPGDAAVPFSSIGAWAPSPPFSPAVLRSVLPELVLHQLRERRQRLIGVVALALHGDVAALGGHQHQHAHDALAVDLLAVLLHQDRRL